MRLDDPAYVTIQIRWDTRPKLRVLAALRGETLMDTIAQIVDEDLIRHSVQTVHTSKNHAGRDARLKKEQSDGAV